MATRVGGASTAGSGTATSIAVTYAATQGNGAVAVIGWNSGTVTCTSVTHTNCTWTLVNRYQANGKTVEVWYCAAVGASPGGTITFNLSATVKERAAAVEEYNVAFASSSVQDATAATNTETGLSGSAHTCSTGTSGATGQAADLWLGAFYTIDNTATSTQTETSPSSGYAVTRNPTGLNGTDGITFGAGLVDQLASATSGGISATVSAPCTSYVAQIVALKFNVTTTTKTQSGVSRVQITSTQTQTGTTRITVTATKTQTGVSRVTATTTQTITGTSRVQIISTQTITGVANIVPSTITSTQTIPGTSRITATTVQTQSGVSRVQITSTQTQLGVSRVTATASSSLQGLAAITNTTARTISGVANILSPTGTQSYTVTLGARIYVVPVTVGPITLGARLYARIRSVSLPCQFTVVKPSSVSVRCKFYVNNGMCATKIVTLGARIVIKRFTSVGCTLVVNDACQGSSTIGMSATQSTTRIITLGAKLIQ